MGTRGPIAHVDRSKVTTRHPPMSVEPAPKRKRNPPVPSKLGTDGKAAWRTFFKCEPLAERLADPDIPVLTRLCETYDRLADDTLDAKGFATLATLASKLEHDLGITSGARARLGISLTETKKATLTSLRSA